MHNTVLYTKKFGPVGLYKTKNTYSTYNTSTPLCADVSYHAKCDSDTALIIVRFLSSMGLKFPSFELSCTADNAVFGHMDLTDTVFYCTVPVPTYNAPEGSRYGTRSRHTVTVHSPT